MATFNERIEAFKTKYISEPAAVENQKSYLLRVRKNDKLTVPQFSDQIKQINLLLAQFPGSNAQQCLTTDEVKRLFYFAMPMKWRTNFINSGQSLHSTTLEALKTYMVYQEQQTDALRTKKNKEGPKKGQGKNGANRKSNSTSTFTHNTRGFTNSNSNKKKRKLLLNEDDCPIHGAAHKWGQCHQNQYDDNFLPRCQAFDANSSHHNNVSSRNPTTANYSA